MNPFNQKPYSTQYEELKANWSQLPAWKQVEKIKRSIKDYPLTFIISGTGSGKTVITPMAAIQTLNYSGKVGVSLPKREITRSVADYASKTMDVELGKEIGFVFKGDKKLSEEETKLVYMTDGILVSAFNKDPDVNQYDILIIDEAHERKVQIDLILLFIKNLLLSQRRPDFRAIIMSATIDKAKYMNYFKGIKSNVIEISGSTNYPIDVHYLDKPTPSYVRTGSEMIIDIIRKDEREDTLFFVTSGNEAQQVCKNITPENPKLFCIEVFADMNPAKVIYAKEKDAFLELGDYDRKVVIATNMAESSLTIKGLSIVIDSCYELFSHFDPQVYGQVLEKKLVTKAQAIQRRGRVGRTAPGTCYHLVTQQQFDTLADYPEPDIIKQDITMVLLQIIGMIPEKSYSAGLAMLQKLMDPPKTDFITAAKNLYDLYKLIESDHITRLGFMVARYGSIPLNRSLFMIRAYELFVLKEAAIICAMIHETDSNMDNLFIQGKRPAGLKIDKKSDHITLLHIFKAFSDAKDRRAWCEKHNAKYGKLRAASRLSKQYFYQFSSTIREHPQARTKVSKKSIVQALKDSHKHLMERIGSAEASSVVDKKKLRKGKYLYDKLNKLGGSWKANIITII